MRSVVCGSGVLGMAVFFSALFLFCPYSYSAIDWGLEGVAPGAPVENILQLTPLDPDDPADSRDDWVPCWGTNPWSRDGQWIVYQSVIGGEYQICKMRTDGTGFQQLTFYDAFLNDNCNSHANFVPGGRSIVFQRYFDGHASIWMMDVNGGNERNLTAAHEPLETGCVGEKKPLVSPDGRKIAFRNRKSIWVMNINGTNPVKISGDLTCTTHHGWSPDSRWVVFAGRVNYDIAGNVKRIFKANTAGTVLTMLSEDTDADFCENWPAWSPDGRWITHRRRDNDAGKDDLSQLRIMDANGGSQRLLASAPDGGIFEDAWICAPHSWHPGSRWIVFKMWPAGGVFCPLFIMDVHTGEIIQLTEDYGEGRMWWGPSGDQILFKEYGPHRDGGLYGSDLLVVNLTPDFLYRPPAGGGGGAPDPGPDPGPGDPASPGGLDGEFTGGAVNSFRLSWQPGTGPVSRYRVYKSTGPGAQAVLAEGIEGYKFKLLGEVPAGELEYTDTGLTPGVKYYYLVVAVDGDGNESPETSEIIWVDGGTGETGKLDPVAWGEDWKADEDEDSGSSCFIATAVYGSYSTPEVAALREFRDRFLLGSSAGRALVNAYYVLSPRAAEAVSGSGALKLAARLHLAPLAKAAGLAAGMD